MPRSDQKQQTKSNNKKSSYAWKDNNGKIYGFLEWSFISLTDLETFIQL